MQDIFVAGTDTSAVTMDWAMAELINHPDVIEKARQEIDSVIGKNNIVQESDIANLPYMQAIVKEPLRLHPAGPLIFRESCQNDRVCGYEIPAETRLFINVWAIVRDPKHWKDPLELKPEGYEQRKPTGCKRTAFSTDSIWKWKTRLPWYHTGSAGFAPQYCRYDSVF